MYYSPKHKLLFKLLQISTRVQCKNEGMTKLIICHNNMFMNP